MEGISFTLLKEGRVLKKIIGWIFGIENNDGIRVGKNTRYKEGPSIREKGDRSGNYSSWKPLFLVKLYAID